jgi:hypothetical protein
MQYDTSDILFSLFKMTFNLKGYVYQEFSFIVKIKKKKLYQILIKLTFSVSVQSQK